MPSVITHLQLICGSAIKITEYVGYAYELVVEKTTKRPHVMDGTTAGGHPLAFKSEVDLKADDSVVVKQTAQTLGESVQTQVLTNLGVIDALEDLITEYGGTVPTSLSDTNAASAQSADDPWADLS